MNVGVIDKYEKNLQQIAAISINYVSGFDSVFYTGKACSGRPGIDLCSAKHE